MGLGDELEPSSDKPFDDEPFDAGVEADEDTDPKKYIEQLTGKLGQSLRAYNDKQGQPDFALEKFAVNSLLSATHTSKMDVNDQDDIINKVKESGSNDDGEEIESSEESNNDEFDSVGSEEFSDDGDLEETILEDEKEEQYFLKNPKKSSIFAPEGSEEANFKHKIVERLHEVLNQEDMSEPIVEPEIAPTPEVAPDKVEPKTRPSRRDKPFLPMPEVEPDPKAIK